MENNELKIRRFRLEDKEGVFNLHKKAYKELPGVDRGNGKFDNDFKDIESVYIRPGGDFFIGTIDDKIIAMGGLKKLSKDMAEIKRMRVDPAFQRNGFGQIILERLEKRARELDFSSIQLDTSVLQKSAQKFYEKNGYKEFKREIIVGLECIFYNKVLKPSKNRSC